MSFLINRGEPTSSWRMAKAIQVIQTKPSIFSAKNLREARLEFIAGTSRLETLEGWLLGAGILRRDNGKRAAEYFLSHFGHALAKNDPELRQSNTWLAIHLYLCFSNRSDPYSAIFKILNSNFKQWMVWNDVLLKIGLLEAFKDNKSTTIESVGSGIRRMFEGDSPLAEIGIITVRNKFTNKEIWLQLGSPKLNDEAILHALALARENLFPTRQTIDFSELIKQDINSYLCLSQDDFRVNIRRLCHSDKWNDYFSFTETANLNSIHFGESIKTSNTMLMLLQSDTDMWF